MTHAERKLRKTLAQEINKGQITIKSAKSVEVYVTDADDNSNHEATDKLADEVMNILGWGGYKCGWGAWAIEKDYVPFRSFNTR